MTTISSNIINIIPVTRARAKLGELTDKATGENIIVLTKGDRKAALVDLDYLTKLQKEVKKIYGKTFIDPALLPYTRPFSDQEIETWKKEDTL